MKSRIVVECGGARLVARVDYEGSDAHQIDVEVESEGGRRMRWSLLPGVVKDRIIMAARDAARG